MHVAEVYLVLFTDPPPKRKGGLKGGLGTRLRFTVLAPSRSGNTDQRKYP